MKTKQISQKYTLNFCFSCSNSDHIFIQAFNYGQMDESGNDSKLDSLLCTH